MTQKASMTPQPHKLSGLFPNMNFDDYAHLRSDIETRGLLEPIWLYEAKVLDGRHRLKACLEAKVEPTFRQYEGDDPLGFIIAMNLKRRHLTESQRAMVAASIANLPHGGDRRSDQDVDLHLENVTREHAAEMMAISPRSVASAAKVRKEGEKALVEAVETGLIAVDAAVKLVKEVPTVQRRAVKKVSLGKARSLTEAMRQIRHEDRGEIPHPEGKYRVIYADPPWEYGNAGLQQYGHASHHYPTMSVKELSELRIDQLAEDNAVLFLWVPSPLLEHGFWVLNAWGFVYKTSFVWDKVRHNFGHYNSVRHEFLLIGTRGSCTPDTSKLIDSVQSIERTDVHSEKPEEFRQIIDRLYTHGARIELFARRTPPVPWKGWGNEPG